MGKILLLLPYRTPPVFTSYVINILYTNYFKFIFKYFNVCIDNKIHFTKLTMLQIGMSNHRLLYYELA